MESTAKIRQPVADTIRVIALTGARRNEIAGLRWRHVNLEKGVIELPLNEHKTGMRTGEIRVIGLPNLAQQIITQQEKRKPNDFVFPPARGSGPLNISKPWRKIRVAAGLNPKNGLHALRHSLASMMADSGSQATHIMAVMGHKNLATSQRYIHMAEDRRSELAEAAAAGISAAMNVKNPPNK
jgi:integrase